MGLEPVPPLERLAALASGRRADAPRSAPPGADPGRAFDLVDQYQLGRAAADVEDQRRAVARLEQFVAAEDGQPGLLLRLDDVEDDPRRFAHALDEFAAVGGSAAGLGRDRP